MSTDRFFVAVNTTQTEYYLVWNEEHVKQTGLFTSEVPAFLYPCVLLLFDKTALYSIPLAQFGAMANSIYNAVQQTVGNNDKDISKQTENV